MRRLIAALVVAGVAAALAVGLLQARPERTEQAPRFDLAAALEQLRGAPEPLAQLHADASRLLGGGVEAVEAELEALEGHPVVVNKWASWCGPCRQEFPIFQRVATRLGREVAFLGVNSFDNRGDAEAFLSRFPVPYPSYVDPDERVARAIGAPGNYPITVFYDRSGRRAFVKQGEYRSEADLVRDLDRYAR